MTYHKIGLSLGEGHYKSKLTIGQVIEIYQSPDKCEYLALVYSVSVSTISRIKQGHTWTHLTMHLPRPSTKLDKLG